MAAAARAAIPGALRSKRACTSRCVGIGPQATRTACTSRPGRCATSLLLAPLARGAELRRLASEATPGARDAQARLSIAPGAAGRVRQTSVPPAPLATGAKPRLLACGAIQARRDARSTRVPPPTPPKPSMPPNWRHRHRALSRNACSPRLE